MVSRNAFSGRKTDYKEEYAGKRESNAGVDVIKMKRRSSSKSKNRVRMRKQEERMKVEKLQKLVPGGCGLNPDKLLFLTADYILQLRMQVDVLEAVLKLQQSCI